MNAERLCNAAEAAIGFIENLKDRSGNKLACDSMIKELRLAIRQAKEPTKVVAFLDGGLIQEVYADREIEFLKIDMDVEGAEDDEITLYPDANGNENSAYISLEETKNYPHSIAAVDKRYVETLFKKLNHLRKDFNEEE